MISLWWGAGEIDARVAAKTVRRQLQKSVKGMVTVKMEKSQGK